MAASTLNQSGKDKNMITVKIDRQLGRKIGSLAAFYGHGAGPWLSDFLRPFIEAEMLKMAEAIQRCAKEKPKS